MRTTLFLFLVCCITVNHAVVPMMTMVRRIYYSRTQYLLPCKVCVTAVQQMKSSTDVNDFIQYVPHSCEMATQEAYAQTACIAILKRNAHALFSSSHHPQDAHHSCVHTYATDCIASQHSFSIVCHKKEENEQCHAVPIHE